MRPFHETEASCSQLLDDWEDKSDNFLTYCKKIIEENNFSTNVIFDMDKVPLILDHPPTQMVDVTGTNSILINTTEY